MVSQPILQMRADVHTRTENLSNMKKIKVKKAKNTQKKYVVIKKKNYESTKESYKHRQTFIVYLHTSQILSHQQYYLMIKWYRSSRFDILGNATAVCIALWENNFP